jgi:hypothetical protein
MDSEFFDAVFISCSVFRLQLPFECISLLEKEGQRLLSGSNFGFKARLFLLFKFGYCSTIGRVVVILVTIVTPHVGILRVTERHFLIIYCHCIQAWIIVVPDLVQVVQILKPWLDLKFQWFHLDLTAWCSLQENKIGNGWGHSTWLQVFVRTCEDPYVNPASYDKFVRV